MAEATKTEGIELGEDGQPKRNFRRNLEDRAETAESQVSELKAQLAGLKRTEAFRSAGINPNDPRQSYFVKGYDGEIDPEPIRAAAVEAGFLTEGGQAQSLGRQMWLQHPVRVRRSHSTRSWRPCNPRPSAD